VGDVQPLPAQPRMLPPQTASQGAAPPHRGDGSSTPDSEGMKLAYMSMGTDPRLFFARNNFMIKLLGQLGERGTNPQLLKKHGCFPWSKAVRPIYTSLQNWTTVHSFSKGHECSQEKNMVSVQNISNISNYYYCGQVSIFNHSFPSS